MGKHIARVPADCHCGGETGRCAICDFGLVICVKCNGAEVAMPTDCPGRPLTEEERELIARGDLDYDMGVWFKDGQPVFVNGRVHR